MILPLSPSAFRCDSPQLASGQRQNRSKYQFAIDRQPENYDVVWTNDIDGASETIRYLQSLGHKDIWYVGNCQLPWFARTCKGYCRGMEEAGLPPRVGGQHSEQDHEIGYLATKSILARHEPVSAIYAGTDPTAIGVYKALRECGIRVPEDISVVGHNDTGAASLHPPLTTVREFPEQVGSNMAELVLNRIAQPDLMPQHITVPTELVKRESCARFLSGTRVGEQEQTREMHSSPTAQWDTR